MRIPDTRKHALKQATTSLVDDLASYCPLSPEDISRLTTIARNASSYAAGSQVRAGRGTDSRAGVILSGWACEQRMLADGRRQIFSIFVPGDAIVLGGEAVRGARSVVALTPLEFADLTSITRHGADAGSDSVAKALAAATAQHQARLFDQIIRIGRHTARERVVHLLLELRDRLEVRGLVKNQSFRVPLTQEVLADTLGLSIVHINRTVRELRSEGLIELRCGSVTLLKPSRLASITQVTDPESESFERAPRTEWSNGLRGVAYI